MSKDPEPTLSEMCEDFTRALHQQLNQGKLTGIALVNGLKAIAGLAAQEAQKAGPAEEVEPWNVLDHLDSLPKAHAKELLKRRIVQLRDELAAHEAALGSWK